MALIATSDLLSLKPIIYAANTDEEGFTHLDANPYYQQVKAIADAEGAQVLPICAKMEQDIAELEGEEKQMFLEELGVEESGLDRLIKCSYALLGLISFLTYGKDECRAWTIKKGTKAPQAAGQDPHRHRAGLHPGVRAAGRGEGGGGAAGGEVARGGGGERMWLRKGGEVFFPLYGGRARLTGRGGGAYDRLYADLLKERDQVLARLEEQRSAGKVRGATHQQLLAQKLTLQKSDLPLLPSTASGRTDNDKGLKQKERHDIRRVFLCEERKSHAW